MKNKITIKTNSGVKIKISSNEGNEEELNKVLNQIIRLDTVMGDEGVCINRNEKKDYIKETISKNKDFFTELINKLIAIEETKDNEELDKEMGIRINKLKSVIESNSIHTPTLKNEEVFCCKCKNK